MSPDEEATRRAPVFASREHPVPAQHLRIPLQGREVHEHGAAGVRHVGDVDATVGAPGEVPDEPGVDGSEQHLAAGRVHPQIELVEDPLQLRPREVGGDGQARQLPEAVDAGAVPGDELLADRTGPRVLPHDGVAQRGARVPVPDDDRLPLVRHPHGGEIGGREARLLEGADDRLAAAPPDLDGVVLHPSWRRIDLLVGTLLRRHHPAHHHRRLEVEPLRHPPHQVVAAGALPQPGHDRRHLGEGAIALGR